MPTKKTNSNVAKSREQLVDDLKAVIADAQNLAEEAKTASGEALQEKVDQAQDQLQAGMKALRSGGEHLAEEATKQTDNLEEMIRKYPWRSLGIATAAGILIDRLIR